MIAIRLHESKIVMEIYNVLARSQHQSMLSAHAALPGQFGLMSNLKPVPKVKV